MGLAFSTKHQTESTLGFIKNPVPNNYIYRGTDVCCKALISKNGNLGVTNMMALC